MKKMTIMQIFLSLMLFSGLTAQKQLNEDEVKSALTTIFDLSNDQNFTDAAKLLLFDEKNEIRPFNYSDQSEGKSVKRLVKKIKAYLDLSDSYEYDSLIFGKMKNLQSANLKVNFKSGDQELTISFLFVKLENSILLAQFK